MNCVFFRWERKSLLLLFLWSFVGMRFVYNLPLCLFSFVCVPKVGPQPVFEAFPGPIFVFAFFLLFCIVLCIPCKRSPKVKLI